MSLLPFSRPTPLFILAPSRFLDSQAAAYLDIETWSDNFEWERDDWGGFKDTVTPVAETIETQTGDCDDYAAVVASWAVARDRDVSLLLCWERGSRLPVPDHIAVVDNESVYSSGLILPMSAEAYIQWSHYERYRVRTVQ